MAINVTVAEQDQLRRKLSVEVPLDEVRQTYDEVFRQMRTNIRVNGFRPGKFPRALAEKRFQSVMASEAMQTLVPKYFEEAVKELSLKPATEPHFDNLDIDKTKPFRFDVEFEVVPTFELLKPVDFTLTEQKPSVTAKDVDARIEELRNARASLADKGDAPAAAGDVVTFDFRGTSDGEPFEGGQGENQRIEVGAGQYVPEFDAAFPGLKAGESKTFPVTFPEDYGQATVAGKTVEFTVTVKSIEQKVPPELDETFFKQFGEEVTTVDELQAHIRQQLEQEQERAAMQAYQNTLADQMREHYDFQVPETLVEQALHEFEHELSHNEPDALEDEAKLAERKAEERKKIEANLRVAYAVDALAKEHNVEADADEVRQRFYLQAYMMRQNPNELLRSPYGRQMLSQIEQSIVTAKTLEQLAGEVLSSGGGKAAGKKARSSEAAEAEAGEAAGTPPKSGKARTPKAASKSGEAKASTKGGEAKAAAKGGEAKATKPKSAEAKASAKPKSAAAKGGEAKATPKTGAKASGRAKSKPAAE